MAQKPRKTAQKKPRADKHTRHALDKFAAGEFAAAAKHCRAALQANPRADDLWHLLAACQLAQHQLDGADEAVRHSLQLAPDNPEYHNTCALIDEQRGFPQQAEAGLRELLQHHPDHADACYNLGRLLLARNEYSEAVAWFNRACSLKPAWNDAYKNLGHACFGLKSNSAARAAFSAALKLAPHDAETLINLGRLAQQDDDFQAAADYLQRAIEAEPDSASLVRLAMLRPIFCADRAEINAHRERIEHDLDMIAGEALVFSDPATMMGAPTFYFAYDGINDRAVMSRFGDIIERGWQPPALPCITRGQHRPRLVFVSAHFKHHAIGRLYAALIERLPRDDFEVAVLSVGQHTDAYAERIERAADISVTVDKHYPKARAALHTLEADVIFYPDVGMENTTYWLAAERLAPVQAMGWGHPVTSGFVSMDYFISSTLLEPPGAADHYREALVQLPTWPVIYDDPGAPRGEEFSRADAGFKPHERLYLCPQSLFKLHPDFDAYLLNILRLDEAAKIVLISSNEAWRKKLSRRFIANMGDLARRICFLPALSTSAFYALMSDADVVLDTIHFSGGITSFEAIWGETPFVTERGAFMRGRVTAGLSDLLKLPTAITKGADDYAARAVELATPGIAREQFITGLQEQKHQLLDFGDDVARAYHGFFEHALESSHKRLGKIAS